MSAEATHRPSKPGAFSPQEQEKEGPVMSTIDEQLDDLEHAHAAATAKGEWLISRGSYLSYNRGRWGGEKPVDVENRYNVAAIVAAHNALPALVREARLLRDALAAAPHRNFCSFSRAGYCHVCKRLLRPARKLGDEP